MKFHFSVVAVLLTMFLAANTCQALNAAGRRTIEMLVLGGPESQRDAAQAVYNGFDRNPEILDVMAEVLLQTYQRPGFVQADAASWMCKALGASGNGRYRGVLLQISDKASERKVRKYAEQSLSMLPQVETDLYVAGTVDLAKLHDKLTHGQPDVSKSTKSGPPPPSGSGNAAFDRITHGMSMEEVVSLLGQPTATTSRITGKAWAPFYYGGDTARLFALYKGKGRIVFSNASQFSPVWRVMDIVKDPSESGYP